MKYKNIKLGFLLISWLATANASNMAYVAKTGPGAIGAGDGAGKEWPTPRFIVNGDCVTDNLTGLMWAKNGIIGFEATNGGQLIAQPNYANTTASLNNLIWPQAVAAINNMNIATTKLCGYSDWRLPNINELLSLINYAARQHSSTPGTWLNNNGFSNVQANYYWSSTQQINSGVWAWRWFVNFNSGVNYFQDVGSNSYVWPVRGGQ